MPAGFRLQSFGGHGIFGGRLQGCGILEEALAVVLEVYGIFGGRAVFWRGVKGCLQCFGGAWHFAGGASSCFGGVWHFRKVLAVLWRGVCNVLEEGLAVF